MTRRIHEIALAAALLAPGCVSSSRFPGVEVGPDDEVTALTLNEAGCGDEGARLEWLEVVGAELAGPTTLLVRAEHPACPTTRFRACSRDVVINTYPGIWEVRLEAHAVDHTRCGGTRMSVLRVDLSGESVASDGELDYVGGVHRASPTDEDEETRVPGAMCVDIRIVPR